MKDIKNLILLLVIATVGLVSCKKDSEVKPIKIENQSMAGGATRNMGGMD